MVSGSLSTSARGGPACPVPRPSAPHAGHDRGRVPHGRHSWPCVPGPARRATYSAGTPNRTAPSNGCQRPRSCLDPAGRKGRPGRPRDWVQRRGFRQQLWAQGSAADARWASWAPQAGGLGEGRGWLGSGDAGDAGWTIQLRRAGRGRLSKASAADASWASPGPADRRAGAAGFGPRGWRLLG